VNIPILLAVGGGGYLFWKWYKAATTDFDQDRNENPAGTEYDDEGLGSTPDDAPPPPAPPGTFDFETGEVAVTQAGLGVWVSPAEIRRDDRTVPADAGGLRTDRASDLLDSELDGMAYGQLARNLEAKDNRLYLFDNPYLFQDSTDPHRFDPLKVEYNEGRWRHQFVPGQLYRIMICEEPIVALCESRPGGVQATVFRVVDRPKMENWNTSAPGRRLWDSDEQKERWWYYDNINPTYYHLRPWPPAIGHPEMQLLCSANPASCPRVGEWAQEWRRNCHHTTHAEDPGYPHITYDPRLDGCRRMTQEEIAVYDAAVLAYDQRNEEAAAERSRRADETCVRNYGVTCDEQRRWAHPDPGVPSGEKQARILSLQERIPQWIYPSDLPAEAAPRLQRLIDQGWVMSEETKMARVQRGRSIYRDRLTLLQRRDVQRDYASIAFLPGVGDFAHIAVGGPWGFVAMWVPHEGVETFRLADQPRQLRVQQPIRRLT